MFQNDDLQTHLQTSSTIKSSAKVIAELNLNVSENIERFGNYRYRPASGDPLFETLVDSYDPADSVSLTKFYTRATDSSIDLDGGITDNGERISFISSDDKEKLFYSLEDCLGRFRPRSGINKLRYFPGRFTHHSNPALADRPRYYMSDKKDTFKYWTSYRKEDGVERGISRDVSGQYYIEDAAPFVVYKNAVPANRIVVKMQTHVGSVNLGPFSNSFTSSADPLFGIENQATPLRWRIQYLSADNNWNDAIIFNQTSTRFDGSPVIGPDGYVEVSYGLLIPEEFRTNFKIVDTLIDLSLLPEKSDTGSAFLVQTTQYEPGVVYVYDGESYSSFPAQYDWYLSDDQIVSRSSFVTELVNPPQYKKFVNDEAFDYVEFQYIRGIRVVAETMYGNDQPLDLIEMSPRLVIDLTDRVTSFSFNKTASDLGVSGLPVGQLIPSTGSISIFDYDDALNENNTNSILYQQVLRNIQFKFFEEIDQVKNAEGLDQIFFVPLKVLYSDGFPEVDKSSKIASVTLRDLLFYFESITAPEIFVKDASVSYAVALLLDSIGFTNYTFRRVENEVDAVIPNFFVSPDRSVAEILQDIAIATQTSMFFDEYNNFIMMSKGYILPSEDQRSTDIQLLGSRDFVDDGVEENKTTRPQLANIISADSVTNNIFNDGKITYTNRYIQRSYGSLKQANVIDKDKSWVYKPVLLWEVSGSETTKSKNDEVGTQSAYSLSAIPLNSFLSANVPTVVNNALVDNTMDLGEGVYWISRYNGYFYANGEIIRYDAVEYSAAGVGDVWIRDNEEYQYYFSQLPFNGKMYPTGLVRIYAEPNYEIIGEVTRLRNGEVAKHGRGQFGTSIVEHFAGLSQYWSNAETSAPVRGMEMDSRYLFSSNITSVYPGVYSERLDKGAFSVIDEENGILETTTPHGFFVGERVRFSFGGNQLVMFGLSASVPYYISSTSLTSTRFSVAESIEDAVDGDFVAVFDDETDEEGAVYLWPDDPEDNMAVTISSSGVAVVTTASPHNLERGQRVFFSTTGKLPNGIEEYATYYAVNIIDANSFNISSIIYGTPISVSGTQSGVHTIFNTPDERYLARTIVVPDSSKIKPGYTVEIESGPGSLRSGTLVTAVHQATRNLRYASLSLTTPGVVRAPSHGLENGDRVYFDNISTGGTLPIEIEKETPYYVVNRTISTFQISGIRGGSALSFSSVDPLVGQVLLYADLYDTNRITLNKPVDKELTLNFRTATNILVDNIIRVSDKKDTEFGKAGYSDANNAKSREASRTGVIKNFLSASQPRESDIENVVQPGTLQSSAFVFTGPKFGITESSLNFLSYIYKPLDNRFVHFGTRLRIVGRVNTTEDSQTALGESAYYQARRTFSKQETTLSGGSGGIGILVNPSTNTGYYFEIIALNEVNTSSYADSGDLHNLVFYKVEKDATPQSSDSSPAIPVKLWGGSSQILVDDGKFTGQYRMAGEENPTVYDIAVEYLDTDNERQFFLYLNSKLVATVTDPNPLPDIDNNNMALFTRGSSRIMFENVYAITSNYSQNTISALETPVSSVFSEKEITVNTSFRKYAISGMIQDTYLSSISAATPPGFQIYFEEFGTIMREAAYFDVRYDKAYPALYAKMSPTFNRIKGYTVSGFRAGAYGAEFLVFNNTDTVLSLDETSGNYLRIQGVTFTQQSANDLTVDEYFNNLSDFSQLQNTDPGSISASTKIKKDFVDIKSSRVTYGRNEFSLQSDYIQDQDTARSLMGWVISKVMKPRLAVGLQVFGMPIVQLGDIVTIDYVDKNGVVQVAPEDTRFVVYSIDYDNDGSGPTMTVYLSEVS
jgi:hypothetical protein